MHSLREQEAPRTRATWQIRRPVRRNSLGARICLAARTPLGCALNLIALIGWTAPAQATVSAGIYTEDFYGEVFGVYPWAEGTDDHKAEKIYLNHSLTFDSSPPGQWGASISFVGSAESQVKGPSAYVQLTGTGGGDLGSAASGTSSGTVGVRYAVAAVKASSSSGTELVPLIIEGYVSAQVDISGPGKGVGDAAVAIFEPGTLLPAVFVAHAVADTYFTPGQPVASEEQPFTYLSDLSVTGGLGATSAPLIIDLSATALVTPVVRTVPVFPGTGFRVDAGTVTGFGFADPLVYIDPTWQSANDYHLDISPGVIPYRSTVPEPGSFPLQGLALASVWLVRRRRPRGWRNRPHDRTSRTTEDTPEHRARMPGARVARGSYAR